MDLGLLWEQLLSRDADRICSAYRLLSHEEKDAVYTHLKRMAEESGWHPEQRLSAQEALSALGSCGLIAYSRNS